MMAKKLLVALDDGHGMETRGKRTPYVSELGRFVHENEFNRAVVKYLDIELRRCGINTLLTAIGDKDVPLADRVRLANAKNADIFVSVHYDALDGKFDGAGKDPEGITVFYQEGSTNGKKLASRIHKYLKLGTPQKDRGVKSNNLYVTRLTKMPAILSENGFMDNKREALLMVETAFQKEVAREHAQGICEYFGVKYVAESKVATVIKSVVKSVVKPSSVVKPKILVVQVDSLFTYDTPNWNDKGVTVNKGDAFTIVDTLTVSGSKMYKIKSGKYITANPKYVTVK